MTLTTVDLRTEAIAEVERLKRSRALLRDADQSHLAQLEAVGTWITRSRKARLRRRLSGRVCLVWRVVFEEPSGRVVESLLVPMLLELQGGANPRSSDWIKLFIRRAGEVLRPRVDVECDAWRTRVTRLVSVNSSLRANRQRAIARRADRGRRNSQPGLLDRRAERERQASVFAAAENERAAVARLQAILETAEVALRPAQLLLVLLP